MSTPLRVLMLEDNACDAELMLREVRQAGFDLDWRRVETETDYLTHLDAGLDVILADYSLPQLDALRARLDHRACLVESFPPDHGILLVGVKVRGPQRMRRMDP